MVRLGKVIVLSLFVGIDVTRINDILLVSFSILHEGFIVCLLHTLLRFSISKVDGQLLNFGHTWLDGLAEMNEKHGQ